MNNQILKSAVYAIIQHALTKGLTLLVVWGIWSETEASLYVTTLAAFLTSFLIDWSVSFYRSRLSATKIITALALPKGSTLDDVHDQIAIGNVPASNTPTNLPPILPSDGG